MANFWLLVNERAIAILQKTIQQTYLSLGAILIATLISVPVGIFIARKERLRNYVLGFNSILQTLPSLAVLGFLLPIFGIGVKTALIALVLYAMLPIIRNTVTGILGIPPDLLEAADGIGLTKYQKIRLVEFPLAIPVIVAGIRTATAMAIGIATLAAFIGAGGLGDFIYEGLSLNNVNLILMGAIPAALLALVLDFIIGRVEYSLSYKEDIRRKYQIQLGIIAIIVALLISIFYFFIQPAVKSNSEIRIGTKNFSEQLILGEMLAQLLEAKTSLNVIRVFNLGGTLVCHRAIVNGEIDVYPEYTGTSYTVILNQSSLADPNEVYNFVQKAYQQQFNLTWLKEFGFNNSNALSIRKEIATREKIKTIEDLKKIASKLTIGVPADFMERPDGFIGLKNKYQLEFGSVRLMDIGLMYKAILSKQLDAIMAFSTDSRIKAYNLVTLIDNRHLFPPYYAAPVIRTNYLSRHPEVAKVLNLLSGKVNEDTMIDLNYQVDILHKSPYEVARQFLQSMKLLK